LQFVDPDRKELNMAYHFESVDIGNTVIWTWKIQSYFFPDMMGLQRQRLAFDILANHDQPRMVSKFGNETQNLENYLLRC
jgi:oligo-1,6-glucosidase